MKTFTTLFLLLITSLIFAQNNALDFNTDDYVAISSFFGLDGLSESIECWVHLPSTSEKGTFLHIGNHDSGYGVGVGASTFDNYGNNLILLYDRRTWINTAKSIGTGWHHIAVTLNTSGNCTPYIDGIEVVASTGSLPITPTGGSAIGAISSLRILSSGTIDEVRVWSDVRTQTEIRANMYKELAGDETGLVAYYKLNETDGTGTAADASPNTNNGTLRNMTNNEWQTSSAFFGPKNCLDFDGGTDDSSPDYAHKVSNVMLNTDDFTMMAWFKADDIETWDTWDTWRCIAFNGTDAGGYGIGIVDGKVGGLFGDETSHKTDEAVNIGQWYHIVMRRSSGTTQFFSNGELLSYSSTSVPNTPVNRFTIGANFDDENEELYEESPFNGQIDEVSVWDAALTDAQIRDVMCKTLEGDETNLVAYYNFDNSSGTKLQSFDGSTTNDLTLVNMEDDDWVTSSAFNTWLIQMMQLGALQQIGVEELYLVQQIM